MQYYVRRRLRLVAVIVLLALSVFTIDYYLKRRYQQHRPRECYGSSSDDRVCHIKNLCFDAVNKEWLHISPEPYSWADSSSNRFLDMSSVIDHNTYYWKWRTVRELSDAQQNTTYIQGPAHLVKRFYPVNIMHLLHDDVLGMWDVHTNLYPLVKDVWFIDEYERWGYDSIYAWLGKPLHQLSSDPKKSTRYTCFKDAVVGNSKRLVWYQYGFQSFQSPQENKQMSRKRLRSAFTYLQHKALESVSNPGNTTSLDPTKKFTVPQSQIISVFARRKTRLILNEDELVRGLKDKYRLPVHIVALEELSVAQIIVLLSRTKIAVGMHGSLLVMAGFMPAGSTLLELFPYAVPPSDYRPYAELCRLLDIEYRAWSSPHPYPPKTIGHPMRPKFDGGLQHLSHQERGELISKRWIDPHKCCYDAAWLYRIFQDSVIDVGEVIKLI